MKGKSGPLLTEYFAESINAVEFDALDGSNMSLVPPTIHNLVSDIFTLAAEDLFSVKSNEFETFPDLSRY